MLLSTLSAEVHDEYWGPDRLPIAIVVLRFGRAEVKRWRTHHKFDELIHGPEPDRQLALEHFVAARLGELLDVQR